jgi:hypothetical protein
MMGANEDEDITLGFITGVVALVAVAIACSFLLAATSWYVTLHFDINASLGMFVWSRFHLPYAPSLDENMFRQFTVDWAFWFVVLCGFYWLYQRSKRSVKK